MIYEETGEGFNPVLTCEGASVFSLIQRFGCARNVGALHRLIIFPEGGLADSVHVPAVKAFCDFAAGTMEAFDRRPDGALGAHEKEFAEMAYHREGGDKS